MTSAVTPPGFAIGRPALSGVSAPDGSSGLDRAGLRKAAEGFEAVFVRQMLAAARQADFGGDDLFGNQAQDTFNEMRDAQFADIAARSGALGMADMIEAQLIRQMGLDQPPVPASGQPGE